MNGKILVIIVAVVIVVVAATVAVLRDDGSSDKVDLTGAANAFAENYDGVFAADFAVDTDENADANGDDVADGTTAKAYWINTAMGGTVYFVSFTECASEDAAKDLFEARKTYYDGHIGPSAMGGLEYKAVAANPGFTGGYGEFGDSSMFLTLHYSAYSGEVYINASLINMPRKADDGSKAADEAVQAIYDAFKNPKDDISVRTMAVNFEWGYSGDYAQVEGTDPMSGEIVMMPPEYTITVNGDTAKASFPIKAMGASEAFVSFTKCKSGSDAKGMYDAQQAQYKAKVGPSAMGGLEYYEYAGHHAGLTAGYGYYGDCNMVLSGETTKFVVVHYTAYLDDIYVDSLFYIYGSNFADHDFEPVIAAIVDAIDC